MGHIPEDSLPRSFRYLRDTMTVSMLSTHISLCSARVSATPRQTADGLHRLRTVHNAQANTNERFVQLL